VIVVSDASPLVILAKLTHLDLLRTLFSQVCISAEVRREVVVSGAGLPGASEVDRADWIETRQVQNRAELFKIRERHGLGIGELSSILLAKELRADIVLLDDYEARKLAKGENLEVRGTLGVLEASFQKGHLADLRGAFSQLLKHSYIDPQLLNERLRAMGLPPL
jgi:predicted nucleic acid-binding protein